MGVDPLPRWLRISFVASLVVAIVFVLYLLNRSSREQAGIGRVSARSDSATVDVTVHHAQCEHGPRVRVSRETARAVRVHAEQGGSCDDVALTSRLRVELDDVLGSRSIEVSNLVEDFECLVDGHRSEQCTGLRED